MAKIIGNTIATSVPVPDWHQTDENKADYIKNKPDIDGINNKIITLESQVADILYEPISIISFKHNNSTLERGDIVRDVLLSWEINKTPKTLTLDGVSIETHANGMGYNELSIKWDNNKTWTLEATDERGAVDTKQTSITFYNGVYYGVATEPTTYDSSFVLGLTKELRGSKLPSFTVDAGVNQYIYYCLPKRYDTCTFTVGGFTGGFSLVDTISFTNSRFYTEDYYIYRSDKVNLGLTTVNIK